MQGGCGGLCLAFCADILLFLYLPASFAMLLLQLHDHEEQEASVGPPQDRPALLVTVRSGQEGEAYQAIDFTDYIIKTVCVIHITHLVATFILAATSGRLCPKHPRQAFG